MIRWLHVIWLVLTCGMTRAAELDFARDVRPRASFPTFLEMAGVTEYEQIGGEIDGVSFVSVVMLIASLMAAGAIVLRVVSRLVPASPTGTRSPAMS